MIAAIATYLPTWAGPAGARVAGGDEDAVTMAVAAGGAVLRAYEGLLERVVLVSRDLPLLEGSNSAAVLAGLGVAADVEVVERLGGAPAALDAVATAPPGTVVLAADLAPAGAGAVLIATGIGAVTPAGRVQRSLPLRVRDQSGATFADDDPRLQRERGLRASLDGAALPSKPVAIAGVSARDAAAFCEGAPPQLPTVGASSAVFALAAMAAAGGSGVVAALEQATISAAHADLAGIAPIELARPAIPIPGRRLAPGPDIKIAFTAYDRAYDAKLRFQAGRCPQCTTLAYPPRHRCLGCGAERTSTLVPLPRTGSVYTTTTVHVPVPGLASPYTLAVVQLDGVDVRALVQVTDVAAGETDIGTRGSMVFRRVAVRSGVPDYGYAFVPEVEA